MHLWKIASHSMYNIQTFGSVYTKKMKKKSQCILLFHLLHMYQGPFIQYACYLFYDLDLLLSFAWFHHQGCGKCQYLKYTFSLHIYSRSQIGFIIFQSNCFLSFDCMNPLGRPTYTIKAKYKRIHGITESVFLRTARSFYGSLCYLLTYVRTYVRTSHLP